MSASPRPVRLDPESFRVLRQAVLERDGWRCQHCGAREDLHVHHQQSRGRGGSDAAENLITLCVACHEQMHGR
jgi:5-methylcytosine-specific restriction endonuclease McrA